MDSSQKERKTQLHPWHDGFVSKAEFQCSDEAEPRWEERRFHLDKTSDTSMAPADVTLFYLTAPTPPPHS